ncbi:NADH:ubiquinone oxidoreductase intermediate-associated protein 30 [Xylariaceae sp. FL0255]|nr:NADH:ubiquinone oxidoreductase intermediate-associated protein 30 [Xylariaceae sp. FL0255]
METTESSENSSTLFGEDKSWLAEAWIASDDRVRGGKSCSYLNPSRDVPGSENNAVNFHGDLDITTLGGAGFASQRSPEKLEWDLSSGFEGLCLKVLDGDGKRYTLVIKDEILPKRPDGREQSTISWEYDFIGLKGDVRIAWDELKPTYRGKPTPDAKPLDLANIKRISIMMRSFFGDQEGPFSIELGCIAAVKSIKPSQS